MSNTTTKVVSQEAKAGESGSDRLSVNARLLGEVANLSRSCASAFGVPVGVDGKGRRAHIDVINTMSITVDGVTIRGAEIMKRSKSKLIHLLQVKLRAGIAVSSGCLNSFDTKECWRFASAGEQARLSEDFLRKHIDDGFDCPSERDEAHYLEAMHGESRNTIGYNIGLTLAPRTPDQLAALANVVSGLNPGVFAEMDDYSGQNVHLLAQGVKKGGLTRGAFSRLTRPWSSPDGVSNVVGMQRFLLTIVESLGLDSTYRGPISYFTRKAIVHAFIYVASLDVDFEALQAERASVRNSSYSKSFLVVCERRLAELQLVEHPAMGERGANVFRAARSCVPVCWLYVFVCVQYQMHCASDSVYPPDYGSLQAIKEAYAPFCVRESIPGSSATRYVKDNSGFETTLSIGAHVNVITQSLHFDWFAAQLRLLNLNDAIALTQSMHREHLGQVELALPFMLDPEEDKYDNILNYVKETSNHFLARLDEYGLTNYAKRFLNAFLTSAVADWAPGGEGPPAARRGDIYFDTRRCVGSFGPSSGFDSLESGIVGVSGSMYNGGLLGMGNIRIKLRCTLKLDAWENLPDPASPNDGDSFGSLHTQLAMFYRADSSAFRIGDNGEVVLILAYSHAILSRESGSHVRCQVAGGPDRDDGVAERVSVHQYKTSGMKDYASNIYEPLGAGSRANGVTCIPNVAPDDASAELERLLMTVPPGNLDNLYNMWIDGGSKLTFSEWLATSPVSTTFLGKLAPEVVRALKLVMPVTNEDTGLCEVARRESPVPHFYTDDTGPHHAYIRCDEMIDYANGRSIRSGARPNSSIQPLRQEVCARTSGLSMKLVIQFIESCKEDGEDGSFLIKSLVSLAYELWYDRAIRFGGGLRALLGDASSNPILGIKYLKAFQENQFVRVVVRQGFERHSYGLSYLDAVMVRLVLGTFLTLQTVGTKLSAGLTIYNLQELQKSRKGPFPDRAILEMSRRNYAALLNRPSIIPSRSIGGLRVHVALQRDIASLMTETTPTSFRTVFGEVQKLLPFAKHQSQGVIADPIQKKVTYVNAVTQWLITIATNKVNLYRGLPDDRVGTVIGTITNAGIGSSRVDDLLHSDDILCYQYSEGLGGEKVVKVSEGGTVIDGIDMVARQMLTLQASYEYANPAMRGQIAMVTTGMYSVYTGIVWTFPSELSQARIVGRKVYVDGNMRFSSKILRGQGGLSKLAIHGFSKAFQDKKELIGPIQEFKVK